MTADGFDFLGVAGGSVVDVRFTNTGNQFEAADSLDTGFQLDAPDEAFDNGMEAGSEIGGEGNGPLPFP